MTKVTKKAFSGSAHLFDGTLAAVVMSLLVNQARTAIAAVTDVTDSSGGVSDGNSLIAPAVPAAFTAGVSDAVLKAEIEASLVVVAQGVKEIVAKLNAIQAIAPVFKSTLTDNMGGAAVNGVIEAVDDSMVGTSSGGLLVSRTGLVTVVTGILNRIEQVHFFVNEAARAVGVAEIVSDLDNWDGVKAEYSTTFPVVSTNTGANVTTTNTVSKVAADALLDTLSDNLATLAAKVNAITNQTPVISHVAG